MVPDCGWPEDKEIDVHKLLNYLCITSTAMKTKVAEFYGMAVLSFSISQTK